MESRSRSAKGAARAIAVLFLPFALCLSSFGLSLDRFAIASMVGADLRVRPYVDLQTSAAQPQSAESQIEAGKRVYLGSCSMTYCHGAGGMGGGGETARPRIHRRIPDTLDHRRSPRDFYARVQGQLEQTAGRATRRLRPLAFAEERRGESEKRPATTGSDSRPSSQRRGAEDRTRAVPRFRAS